MDAVPLRFTSVSFSHARLAGLLELLLWSKPGFANRFSGMSGSVVTCIVSLLPDALFRASRARTSYEYVVSGQPRTSVGIVSHVWRF
ncbi:hypothetical protein [Paenibacillus sp.]|uniref:hypothetical protein n=1 Tax=Paenibacillus sp. TaxID=58172 RepID=UPI0028116309|nr:hypothetical protein [Paenibacillus sp.]